VDVSANGGAIRILVEIRPSAKCCGTIPAVQNRGFLAQSQVTGADMRVNPVLAVAALLEGTKKATMTLAQKNQRAEPGKQKPRSRRTQE
jgi:hypothetical protein